MIRAASQNSLRSAHREEFALWVSEISGPGGVGISCGLKYNRRALTGDGGNSSAAVLVALERNASTSNKEKETSNSNSCCRFQTTSDMYSL